MPTRRVVFKGTLNFGNSHVVWIRKTAILSIGITMLISACLILAAAEVRSLRAARAYFGREAIELGVTYAPLGQESKGEARVRLEICNNSLTGVRVIGAKTDCSCV